MLQVSQRKIDIHRKDHPIRLYEQKTKTMLTHFAPTIDLRNRFTKRIQQHRSIQNPHTHHLNRRREQLLRPSIAGPTQPRTRTKLSSKESTPSTTLSCARLLRSSSRARVTCQTDSSYG